MKYILNKYSSNNPNIYDAGKDIRRVSTYIYYCFFCSSKIFEKALTIQKYIFTNIVMGNKWHLPL